MEKKVVELALDTITASIYDIRGQKQIGFLANATEADVLEG